MHSDSRGRKRIAVSLALVGSLMLPAAMVADGGKHLRPPEAWKDYEPGERHQMRQRYLNSLPEETRDRLRDQAKRFRELPKSNQRDLCLKFRSERGYVPPACQRLLKH